MVLVVVERWRLRGYICFALTVVSGILLTKAFAGLNEDDTLLIQVFGYNNICLYFDFPPSNYIMPLFWAITATCMLVFAVANIIRLQAFYAEGLLPAFWYKVAIKMKIFEIAGLVLFSMIFAVSPEGWDHTLVIHTTPFLLLEVALVSLALSDTIEGIKAGYFESLGWPEWYKWVMIGYDCVFMLVVAVKVPWTIVMMANGPTGSIPVARFFDNLFVVCAVVIPLLQVAYRVKFNNDKLKVVRLTPDVMSASESHTWTPAPRPPEECIHQVEHVPSSDLGFCWGLACLIVFIIFWNIIKLPFYLPLGVTLPMTNSSYDFNRCDVSDPPLSCHGMMTTYPLSAVFGFQGAKLLADPQLFLGPHTIMGIILLSMVLCVIREWKPIESVSYVFLPLSFIFAIHILPISHGVPSSSVGWNINALVCTVVICGSLVGGVSLLMSHKGWYPDVSQKTLQASWIAVGSMCLAAPTLEWNGIINTLGDRARNGGSWVMPDLQRPHEESSHDFYGSCGCPGLGWFMSIVLVLSTLPCCWYGCDCRTEILPDSKENVEEKQVLGKPYEEKEEDKLAWK